MKKYYLSCINEEQIEKDDIHFILSFLNNQFQGWPILQQEQETNQSNLNLMDLLIKLNEFNHFSLFYVTTSIDEKNSSSYSIYVILYQNIFIIITKPFIYLFCKIDWPR